MENEEKRIESIEADETRQSEKVNTTVKPNLWWRFIYNIFLPLRIVGVWLGCLTNHADHYENPFWWIDLCTTAPYVTFLGLYTIWTYVNRKSNASFVAITFFMFHIISSLSGVLMLEGSEATIQGGCLFWYAIFFITFFTSRNYKALFPKKERKVVRWNWLLLIPHVLYIIGIVYFLIFRIGIYSLTNA